MCLTTASARTLLPSVPWAQLLPRSWTRRAFDGPSATQEPKCSGRIVVCAATLAAKRPTRTANTRICLRMYPAWLDADRLLLVPGLFNGSGRGGPGRSLGTVYGDAVHALQIGGDTSINPFGDPLAVLRLLQELLIRRVAEEGDLRKDRGHIRANEYDKRRLANTAIPDRLRRLLNTFCQGVLNVLSQFLGLVDFLGTRDFLDQIFQVVDAVVGRGVFACCDFHGFGGAFQVEVIGFHPARAVIGT